MIRRDDGDDWLVISQVDHAHLAGEIAAVWGNDTVSRLPLSDWLIVAVRNHDEGWRSWEQTPHINIANGKPREFLEMPMDEATAIWSESIAACNSVPMGRVWVSRHFQYLARLALDARKESGEEVAALNSFLAEQAEIEHADRASYASLPELKGHYDELAEEGFRYVQMFDRMSLWLCCADRTTPQEFKLPDRNTIRFTPCDNAGLSSSANSPRIGQTIAASPNPLSVDRLELSVPARRIAARQYANDASYHTALTSAPVEYLCWTIS